MLSLAAVGVAGAAGDATPAAAPAFRVLAFTKTTGFRHTSIPAAISALRTLGDRNGFAVDQTEDAGAFTDANLGRYKVVVFLLTTGDVLDDGQQAALQRFVEAGHGWVGVHSAADTEYDWPWYGALLGAYFYSHPAIQPAALTVTDAAHPATTGLPSRWMRTDEWYGFRTNPRPSVHVLLTIDETTYDPSDASMGADHPMSWWHDYDGGRAFYTALGHTDESYSEPLFLGHLLGGVKWAAGAGASPEAVAPAARISSLAVLRSRRVVVTLRHAACACDAVVRVVARGRTTSTKARADSPTTRLTTAALPRGRWQVTIVLTNRASGKSTTLTRRVTVR
jgi:type 1 glutamine amidotransferase